MLEGRRDRRASRLLQLQQLTILGERLALESPADPADASLAEESIRAIEQLVR